MQCPKCGSGFKHLVITTTPGYGGTALNNERMAEQIEVDQCLSCNGVWFSAEELNEFMKEKIFLVHSSKVAESNKYYKATGACPKCEKPMQQVPFKNVVVDRCSICQGVWFDGGLLDRVEKANFGFGEMWRLVLDRVRDHSEKL